MAVNNITAISIFFAGILSFFSPCVLPMLPIYSLMLAESVDGQKKNPWNIYINSICFLCGFTLIFLLMGATASFLGQYFLNYQNEFRKAGAIIIFFMGLSLTGILSTSLLGREFRPFLGHKFRGPLGSFLLGIAFTTGWTPCIGPILATILVYAGRTATMETGVLFLLIYSMGFSIPFFLITTILRKFLPKMRWLYRYLPLIQKIIGYTLIVLSILLWLNMISKIIGLIYRII